MTNTACIYTLSFILAPFSLLILHSFRSTDQTVEHKEPTLEQTQHQSPIMPRRAGGHLQQKVPAKIPFMRMVDLGLDKYQNFSNSL